MTTEAEALAAASRWAARYALLPGTFTRLVTSVTVEQERYARAVHHVERRAIALRALRAYQSKARDVRAFSVPRDPWSVDPTTIEDDSRCVTTCPSCDGDKRVRCGTCAGRAEVRCGQCAGLGRVMGQRGTKNCPGCRGRGLKKCSECRVGVAEDRAQGAAELNSLSADVRPTGMFHVNGDRPTSVRHIAIDLAPRRKYPSNVRTVWGKTVTVAACAFVVASLLHGASPRPPP